jgi:Anti-sigma-K factor rskA
MSHDDWADYLDPDAPDPTLTEADRAILDQARHALRDSSTWDSPPPQLEARILAEARRTPRETPAAAPPAAPAAPRAVTPITEAPSRRRRLRPALALVAAAAAAVIAVVVLAQGASGPPTEQYALAGTLRSPQATAEATIESRSAGDAITLDITGLPPAPAGTYYAAWVSGPRGTVPVGSFHWRKGGIPIELWSGVDTRRYPRFSVTLQREGAPPTMSRAVFLRGSLQP